MTDLDPTSLAFVLDPGRIYVNRKGRFAQGVVTTGEEAAAILARITDGMLGLEYRGDGSTTGQRRRPVQAVHRRDDVYDGPCLDLAPDAVLRGHDGFDLKGSITRTDLFGRSALTGMHTYDDALFSVTCPGFPTEGLTITDLAPTLLALLGCPPMAPMDGRALAAA
jgi:predicted AlkP superfamily phosphohydrolase/phosphomutase